MSANSIPQLALPNSELTSAASPRTWLTPVFGAMLGYAISWLPALFQAPALDAWAALTLLLGFIYLALLPNCRCVWIGLTLAIINIAVGLEAQHNGEVLKLWLGSQTIFAAIWLLRREQPDELSAAGLILGLSASATALMPLA